MADVNRIGSVSNPIYKEALTAEQLKKDVEAKAVAEQEISVETKKAKKIHKGKLATSPMEVVAATQKKATGVRPIKKKHIPKGKAIGYWKKSMIP